MFERLLEKVLSKGVSLGRLDLTYSDGRQVSFGTPASGYPDIAIRFTDAKVPRDIVSDPRLGAGEAYMDGRIVIESGDVMSFVQLIQSNNRWERKAANLRPGRLRRLRNSAKHRLASFNEAASSRRNVAHHYDIGNALYELMLDAEHMQYSCAYWPRPDMTLGQAQTAKLAHIAAKLALAPGQRVLDIGCGWGGMAIFLARHADVNVHGITLSSEQLALAQQRAERVGVADKVSFELVDYRDLPKRGDRFDRIVSVGMFEHVGRPQFETFFHACAQILADDGVMLLHTIGRMGGPGKTDAFTQKYVFPGGYIPALSETLVASEKARLIATDVETLRLHYARTLREWYARCMEHKDEIVAMFDERFFRMWTFYLSGAMAAFESGGMCNYQIQYARDRHALPLARDYMGRAETGLLEG
ncbi:MAG: class I SAM-dependent methyltransferase [Novosphingobium sp.]|nr:class I SAM-dependent methyltransferase [Novosphingobium sp.]